MQTNLNVFGVIIEIESDKKHSDWIKHDYGKYILENTVQKPDLKFSLKVEKPQYEKLPRLTASMYHDNYIVYDDKDRNIRIIDFFGDALSIHKIKEKITTIICNDPKKAYDIFYMSFESLL